MSVAIYKYVHALDPITQKTLYMTMTTSGFLHDILSTTSILGYNADARKPMSLHATVGLLPGVAGRGQGHVCVSVQGKQC